MAKILRWGQSAYETELDLSMERRGAEELGYTWRGVPETVSARDLPLRGVEVLVTTSRVRVTAEVLARFTGRLVLTTTSGTDHLDLHAAKARGITIARCPLARRDAVVEHTLGSLIALMRRIPQLHEAGGQGRWARGDLPTLAPRTLAGATVLLVGLGVIGRRTATLLQAMGATVLGVDPAGLPQGVTRVSLNEALPRVDAVSLHCGLTPTSHGLLSADRLRLLPAHAVVVNTCRGAVLDPHAAVEAVAAGRLRGAAIDVFPQEPWPALAEAAHTPGVWLTPHASGFVHDLGRRVAAEVIQALTAHASGQAPAHVVTPSFHVGA